MEITSQAQLRESSHIFVVIKGGSLSLIHVVADYEGGRSFSHTFTVSLPRRFNLDHFDAFLANVLLKWQKNIDWEFIDCDSGVCLKAKESEWGLDGATILIASEFYVDGFTSSLLGVEAEEITDNMVIDGMASYFESLGASELVSVFLDWDEIVILVLARNPNIQDDTGKVYVKEFRIKNTFDVTQFPSSFSKVLSLNFGQEELAHYMYNVFHKRIDKSTSVKLWDIMRGYITLKLFELKDSVFKEFGFRGSNSILLVGGDLVRLAPQNFILLAVIDGLQLRGRYKISIDESQRLIAGVSTLGDRKFICPIDEVYPLGYNYLSTEKGGSGKKGNISFRGKLLGSDIGDIDQQRGGTFNNKSVSDVKKAFFEKDVGDVRENNVLSKNADNGKNLDNDKNADNGKNAGSSKNVGSSKQAADGNKEGNDKRGDYKFILGQVGRIYSFDIPGSGEYHLQPAKDVYFPNLVRDGKFLKGRFDDKCKKLIIDCRRIPVVYGPDVTSNAPRVRNWLQGIKC
jgi:hypothetical protein